MRASALYEGRVRHRRMDAVEHRFSYPILLPYLDLDELPELFDGHPLWSARRPALAWFRRADYLGDPSVPLAEAVRRRVHEQTGDRPNGPVRMLAHLRTLGHCFNPVSFYFCFHRDGIRLTHVAAEVTNTPWGERHAYVMPCRERADHGTAGVFSAGFPKALHVSPFMAMDHHYQWRLTEPGERLSVHIESRRAERVSFDATLQLRRREITAASLRHALVRQDAGSLAGSARIYAQALRLHLKGARYHAPPAAHGSSPSSPVESAAR